MDIVAGNAVYSRAGKDKGTLYFVLKTDGEFVYLSDGNKRKIHNMKKKRIKHLNRTNFVSEEIGKAFAQGILEDYMIRKALAELKPI